MPRLRDRNIAFDAIADLLPTVTAANLAGAHTVCVPLDPLEHLIHVVIALYGTGAHHGPPAPPASADPLAPAHATDPPGAVPKPTRPPDAGGAAP